MNEFALKAIITQLVIGALHSSGCNVKYIMGNNKLMALLTSAVNDIYRYASDALNEENDNLVFLDSLSDDEFNEKFGKKNILFKQHLTRLLVSGKVATIYQLMGKISTLTGKTQSELFDNNFDGLLKL